jgi:hypothetical protein
MDINLYSKNNPPPIESIKNNGKILDLKCLGFVYQRHSTNKKSWNYRCVECPASISVKLVENVPIVPYEVTYLNIVHTHEAEDDSIWIVREFVDKVGLLVRDQPHTPIQQIWDREFDEFRRINPNFDIGKIKGYEHYRSSFNRIRNEGKGAKATCLGEVVVNESMSETSDGKRFLLFDNKKVPNRIIAFCSDLGIFFYIHLNIIFKIIQN